QDAGAISQLTIERKDGIPIRGRNWRTVIRKPCRPQPFFTDPQLLPDRDMTGVREMQVGGNIPLVGRRDSYRELAECRPVLPSDVSQQTPLGQNFVETAQHHLLRLCQRDINFYSSDFLTNKFETRAETRDVRPKAELVVLG